MQLLQLDLDLDVARVAADYLSDQVRAQADLTVLLPAGRTPVPLYAEIQKRVRAGTLSLTRAHFFQLDEYVGVSPEDPRSFHAFLRHHLLDPLEVAASRTHLIDGAAEDPDLEIRRHAAALEALGGACFSLLGVGANGHVAFNEPGSTAESTARRVPLAEMTLQGVRREFTDRAPPREGLTLGMTEIAHASTVVLLATGPSKAAIVQLLAEKARKANVPVSLLCQHPGFLVLVDASAYGPATRQAGSMNREPEGLF